VATYEADGWGVGELYLEDDRLLHHELPAARKATSVRHPLGERLRRYFAGESDDFVDVEIDLAQVTTFQRAITDSLRAISYGETVTYGELAALAGHPNAQRAAGTFCAHNRFPIIVPCHRVVAANGLGSYGSLGVDYNRRLLALEGHEPF
jgi:methylated-DNA-[protein]-cysteine S-methyltransferase